MMDSFKVDVEDQGDHYLLKADLPGVAKENVHIALQEGVLTISAETCEEKEQKETNYLFRERRTGSMSRSFNVEGIDEEAISAAYADGVLSLTLPKLAEEKPTRRTIQIN